jgi:hypothetical protein
VERRLTDLFAINPEFVAKQREDDGTITVSVDLPTSVRTDTLDRKNIDTSFGWLLEVTFLKKKEIDQSKLVGRRFSHIECAAKTTEQLQHNIDPTEGKRLCETNYEFNVIVNKHTIEDKLYHFILFAVDLLSFLH